MPKVLELADWLDERQERYIAIADEIWANPELALAETKACALQADALAAEGFAITRNVGALPTAFMAEWGSGSPVIGFLGEYDALPSLSQKIQPGQEPIVPGGPGHGCGHNLLGTAALAAAVALKAWIEVNDGTGTVRYYGCPAEETGAGKVYMARDGAFDDLDAAFTWHPGYYNSAWTGSSLAIDHLRFRFHGKTAHAAGAPEMGRSALDAVELMNVGANYLREHVIDSARIHYVITNGGGAPNVVPDEAEVWYYVRAPLRDQVEAITERVRKIAMGAALMTETQLEEYDVHGLHNVLPNDTLSALTFKVLQDLGSIEFSEEERTFAKGVTDGFPDAVRAGIIRNLELPPEMIAESLVGDVRPPRSNDRRLGGSTDVAEVSWIAPTAQVTTTCWALGVPGHSWGITATGGMSIGHKGMLHAAKALAITAATVHGDPELLRKAKAEHSGATGGRPYKAPLPDGALPHLP